MENKAFETEDKLHRINGNLNKNAISVEMPQFYPGTTTIPITFSWKDLTVKVKGTESKDGFLGIGKRNPTNEKLILDKVSGYCKPGELLAIMGASGAGKSTLLNTLTFRNLDGLSIIGNRYGNSEPITPNSLTSVSAYVQQDDLFIGTLTVQEHLNFQAAVRMDNNIPQEKRKERIEQVKEELGLKKCENTLIGAPGRIKGISGGEKRRLSFASEVLTNPSIMFCDEPTSGLDSFTAQNVVEVLKKLAQSGKTVIATIHQPNSQVFALFDRLLLMAEGRVAFFGGTDEAVNFFENRAHLPCPLTFNPADHYVHVMAVTPGKELECRQRVKEVCDTFRDSEYGKRVQQELHQQLELDGQKMLQNLSLAEEKQASSPYKASWWSQFKALLWRSFLSVSKEPIIMKVRIVQTTFLALLLGVLFLGQDNNNTYDQAGIMNVNGALYNIIINLTFTNMFAVVAVFSMETPIFLREHFNGMYRTEVYYLSKQIADLPMFLITPVIFVTLFYFMVGMNLAADRFFWCILIAILVTQVIVGVGYMISCATPNAPAALALAPTVIIPFMIVGGFFLNDASIPDWLIWLKYLSWYMYGNELLNINQWENVNITDCNPTNISEDFCYPNGDAILKQYGFKSDDWAFDMGMLAVLAVAFRIVGYFLLLKKTYRKSK